MKVVHWVMKNRSGMHAVGESMARGELSLGVDARCLDPFEKDEAGWEEALDADIHVSHTHIPHLIGGKSFKKACTKPYRFVFPIHGTPELVFENSIKDAEKNDYNSGTSYANHQWGMQQADAIFTFWPRHQWLYNIATDKSTIVDLIPMGIDTAFWSSGVSGGKFVGAPSFFISENSYPFKWCVEIMKLWPKVREELDQAVLHCTNIPGGIMPFITMLAARYGTYYGGVIGSWSYPHETLRSILKSVDYYVSPVRYGDHNRMSLEAGAAGTKVISYPSNEYADYWIPEGDHRNIATQLIAIGKGDVAPREKLPIPTEQDMGRATINAYERVLDRPRTNWALGGLADAIPAAAREALATARGGRSLALVTDDVEQPVVLPPAVMQEFLVATGAMPA